MCCRNEDWVLGLSARAALMWCDELVILNHASTDGTAQIIADLHSEFPGRIGDVFEPDGVWQEMTHRQRMLDCARSEGATHIAIVDADEVLSGNLLAAIRAEIERASPGVIVAPHWTCLARGLDRYYTSGPWAQHFVSMAFADFPELHWEPQGAAKYDFHHRHPMGCPLYHHQATSLGAGGLMHLQFVSERRLRAKQALYQMVEVIRWPGRLPRQELARMYGRAVYESDPERVRTAKAPREWWLPYMHLMKYMHIDAEPWQEAECRRLAADFGEEYFAGLDLFGVLGRTAIAA